MKKACNLLLLSFLCFLPIFIYATNSEKLSAQTEKLKQLNKQIATTQSSLQNNQQSAEQLTQQLEVTEQNIGDLSQNMQAIDQQIANQNQQLIPLQKQAQQLNQQLQLQRANLANVIRSAYENRQETYLKLILNQEDPEKFSRLLEYYKYYSAAQVKIISRVTSLLVALNNTQKQIQLTVNNLNDLRQQRLAQQIELKKSRQQRKVILAVTKQKIETQQEKLARLLENKHTLENIVNQLRNTEFLNSVEFSKLKGYLPWPVRDGRITEQFGSKEFPQSLPSQGVFISAPIGRDVDAIAAGKIVYAGWLKDFGLLIIIDHGKGYMSLYAHCNSFLTKVNDIVEQGTVIATTGNSGGIQNSGIMFQLRQNGKPLNPNSWCRGQAVHENH